ncbi:metallophosphoesterase family protein [Flavimaricola marinus]|uniref:Serine/threonine-protein phosphatase 1 n=1 Tax=Flavimaricola marinus TaxID=1819565 RepID=A0A238LHN8_9RHOB|nr:metallophosphoesterase family protein [Flavimaricola marinus]SMY09148.1 Serine/threonine-protein phosphatase 1 [Flavimaricola marinus]
MPEPDRLYAIGDIHGQLDLLRGVHDLIAADRQQTGDWTAPVVHLGDLVDRGPDSAGVIDFLLAGPAKGGPWVTIKGNHDYMFSLFMCDPPRHDPSLRSDLSWLHPRLGGMTTLASYGIADTEARTPDDLHREATARVPASHLAFLRELELTFSGAGAFCVHAGVRPGVALDAQEPSDLMWIRREFHDHTESFGPLIVHGHTPVDQAVHYGNRLNLDTGAAYGGPLTVAVIESGKVALLTPDGRRALPADPRSTPD